MRLILASKSPRRKRILEKMGFEFEIEPSDVDESKIKEDSPEKLVMALAELKASCVAKKHKEAVVLGADTIVYNEGRIIGKARSEDEAMKLLKSLLGKEHLVYTGMCAINIQTGEKKTDFVISKVKLKDVSEEELNAYVYSGFYKGKAGAYNIDDPEFKSFIEKIDGCRFNILGLGFAKCLEILKSVDLTPKDKA